MEEDENETAKISSFVEKMTEHVFIAEILQETWINYKKKIEILKAEVDDSGYDIVLACNDKLRFIQLKASDLGGTTKKQLLNINLKNKPSPCIIWIVREEDETTKRYKLSYLYWDDFINIKALKVAKHPKPDKNGIKQERPNIREINKRDFEKISTTKDLIKRLFDLE